MYTYYDYGWAGIPGTCLWCGRKIPRSRRFRYTGQEHSASRPIKDGSELFHSDSCTAQFGARMAGLGRRFEPVRKTA